eukprot:7253288-Prymnesium_polylepis.1
MKRVSQHKLVTASMRRTEARLVAAALLASISAARQLGKTSYSPVDDAAKNPWAAHCSSARWTAPDLTTRQRKLSGMAKALRKMNRWPQLNGTELRFMYRWDGFMNNFVQIEPLSVAAFIEAVRAART